MSYEINRYQAERLSAALSDIRDLTNVYIANMAFLLGEALDEEGRNGALCADALADVIGDHLHDELTAVTEAVRAHYDIESPTRFARVSEMRVAA